VSGAFVDVELHYVRGSKNKKEYGRDVIGPFQQDVIYTVQCGGTKAATSEKNGKE